MNHAPAPWTVDTHRVSNKNGEKDYTIIRILDAEGRLVTEMTDLSRTEQNLKNAEVIAQAPEMFYKLGQIERLLGSDLTDAHIVDKLIYYLKEST